MTKARSHPDQRLYKRAGCQYQLTGVALHLALWGTVQSRWSIRAAAQAQLADVPGWPAYGESWLPAVGFVAFVLSGRGLTRTATGWVDAAATTGDWSGVQVEHVERAAPATAPCAVTIGTRRRLRTAAGRPVLHKPETIRTRQGVFTVARLGVMAVDTSACGENPCPLN
jgi:hypothetical protein